MPNLSMFLNAHTPVQCKGTLGERLFGRSFWHFFAKLDITIPGSETADFYTKYVQIHFLI